MTEEVLIELMSDPPPQGSLDLSPLGKTLVVALLNEDAYTQDKQAGRHLNPVQASSTVTAAYWYMPMVKLPITDTYELELKGEKKKIDLANLLPDSVTEQEILYWTGCESDEDLVNHFTPNAIVDRMQPAKNEDKNKQLGILTRLRIASGAYKDLITRLDSGLKWDGKIFLKEKANDKTNETEKYDLVSLLNKEKERLGKKLKEVRNTLKKSLESYEIPIEGDIISIKNQALNRDLYNNMGEDLPEKAVQQYGKFLELKRHYDRVKEAKEVVDAVEKSAEEEQKAAKLKDVTHKAAGTTEETDREINGSENSGRQSSGRQSSGRQSSGNSERGGSEK